MGRKLAARALEQAADLYESGQLEWVQGQLRIRDGSNRVVAACLVGCVNLVIYGDNVLDCPDSPLIVDGTLELAEVAYEALFEIIGIPYAAWNDKPERTKAEVIDALKMAAKDLRNANPS